jgi:hypothetical protein
LPVFFSGNYRSFWWESAVTFSGIRQKSGGGKT